MFGNYFKNFFGTVYVQEESNGTIIVGGLNVKFFIMDMKKIWGNPKLMSAMFIKISQHALLFDKFFAVDVLYMFEQIHLYKRRKSNFHRIGKVIDGLREHTWLKSMYSTHDDILDMSRLKNIKHTLFDHQLKAVEAYNAKIPKMKLKGYLLAAEVGTGKTLISLAIGECLNADIVIAVCPKTLTNTVWEKSIIEEYGSTASVWNSAYDVSPTAGFKFYIIHYEYLNKILNFIRLFRDKKVCLILDESHYLNDITSQRTRNFIQFSKEINCQHNIFASGTAVKAMGSEMLPLLHVLDDLFTPSAAERFKKVYGISAKRGVDVLRHRLDLIGHKIPKTVVMKIPPPIVHQLRIKIPKGERFLVETVREEMKRYIVDRTQYYKTHMSEYEKIYMDSLRIYRNKISSKKDIQDLELYHTYITDIRRGYDPVYHKEMIKFCNKFEKTKIMPSLVPNMRRAFKEARTVIKYVQLKVLGEALGNVLSKKRIECHTEMIQYSNLADVALNADKKMLCFSSYKEVLKEGYKYFTKNKFAPLIVHGENAKDLNAIVAQFINDVESNPLLGSIKMLQAGVTFVNCSVVVLLDLPFRDYIREQATHRIHRIGQDTQTHIIECTLDTGDKPNISTRAQDILEWSKTQADAILGKNIGTDDIVGIVDYMHLNPNTKMDRFVNTFRNWFNI